MISDEAKVPFYAAGEKGSWQGSSRTRAEVVRGSGAHADMLEQRNLAPNAALVRDILAGSATGAGTAASSTTDSERTHVA